MSPTRRKRVDETQRADDEASGADDADDAVFKALASPTRRRMLDVLKQATRTTGELCAAFPDLDRTTVLQHLRVLEAAELVTGRKIGRERHLAIAPLPIKRISDRWIGEYARAAVDLLDALSRPDQRTSAGARLTGDHAHPTNRSAQRRPTSRATRSSPR